MRRGLWIWWSLGCVPIGGSIITHLVIIGGEGGALSGDLIGGFPDGEIRLADSRAAFLLVEPAAQVSQLTINCCYCTWLHMFWASWAHPPGYAIHPLPVLVSQKIWVTSLLTVFLWSWSTWSIGFFQSFWLFFWLPDFNISWKPLNFLNLFVSSAWVTWPKHPKGAKD